jgi:NAD-dependent SIR2 family protein deacetylase
MSESHLDQLARQLQCANHIVVLSGAGMSTESGIPDFRSANGLWTRDMSLAEAISVDYFHRDPVAFWQSFKSIFSIKLAGGYQPNDGHLFLAWLEACGKRVTVLTQNIDGLHHRAGSREVIELHGTLMTAHCPSCGTKHGLDYINRDVLPQCSVCADVLKPDVVLYGEAVPNMEKAMRRATEGDFLLVMGSSLEVSPVNYLPVLCAERQIPSALINLSATRLDSLFTITIRAGIGETCQKLRQCLMTLADQR